MGTYGRRQGQPLDVLPGHPIRAFVGLVPCWRGPQHCSEGVLASSPFRVSAIPMIHIWQTKSVQNYWSYLANRKANEDRLSHNFLAGSNTIFYQVYFFWKSTMLNYVTISQKQTFPRQVLNSSFCIQTSNVHIWIAWREYFIVLKWVQQDINKRIILYLIFIYFSLSIFFPEYLSALWRAGSRWFFLSSIRWVCGSDALFAALLRVGKFNVFWGYNSRF